MPALLLRTGRTLIPLLCMVFTCAGWLRPRCAQADDFVEGFDSEKTSWSVHYEPFDARLISHRRNAYIFVRGRSSEMIQMQVTNRKAVFKLEHKLPPARVFDELKLTLWYRSNQNGAVPAVRLIFPHHRDPRTGAVLSTYLHGTPYSGNGKWQQVMCSANREKIQKQIQLLRARLNDPKIDTRDMYADRAILHVPLAAGPSELLIDEMRFGPVVAPRKESPIIQASSTAANGQRAEFRLDRLMVDKRPFFPRITPYHGESIDQLPDTGLNVLWIQDYTDHQLLSELQKFGIWAAAIPPPLVEEEDSQSSSFADPPSSATPFSQQTASILMWYAGTRVTPNDRRKLTSWVEQIRNRDRDRNRPIMADVTGQEWEFSRVVSMIGSSRHMLNSSMSMQAYRDWLLQKRRLARPGSFCWTWIQTEPTPGSNDWRKTSRKHPVVIEPEQIRLQVYAALASGVKGIGYWKTLKLDADTPGAYERRLAISQLNQEIELLQPWLATGKLVGQIPFSINGESLLQNNARFPFRRSQRQQPVRVKKPKTEFEAAVIRSDYGLLLLPVWYEKDAQYVPGQMVANNATFIVPGVDESAAAWEVTTTGIRSLNRERVTGGIRIVIPKFDQTTAIVLTSDLALVDKLRQKANSLARSSSQISVNLAKAKLARVSQVDEELRALQAGQSDSAVILQRTRRLVLEAEAALAREAFSSAKQHSADAMQLLRILQRAYWNDAVRSLSSPVSSPYAVCFQTLPDHWRMIERIGRSQAREDTNLLRSGTFEDIDTMIVEGWKHRQTAIDGVQAEAELYPANNRPKGKYCLRLIAVQKASEEPLPPVVQPPVRVTTPGVPVRAGQIAHISGWIRVASAIRGSSDGVTIYDNLNGPSGALRFTEASDWKWFEMLREVQSSGDLHVDFVLNGLGEVQFDDVQIRPLTPRSPRVATAPDTNAGESRSRSLNPLDLLQRLNPLRSNEPAAEGKAPELPQP